MCSPPAPSSHRSGSVTVRLLACPLQPVGDSFILSLFGVQPLPPSPQRPAFSSFQAFMSLSLSCWSDGAVPLIGSFAAPAGFHLQPRDTPRTRPRPYLICHLNPPNTVFFISRLHSVRVSRASDLPLGLKQLIFLACVLPACITGCLSANLHLGVNPSLAA